MVSRCERDIGEVCVGQQPGDIFPAVMAIPTGWQGRIRGITSLCDIGDITIDVHRVEPGECTFGRQGKAESAARCQDAVYVREPGVFINDPAEGVVADYEISNGVIRGGDRWLLRICRDGGNLASIISKDHGWAAISCSG